MTPNETLEEAARRYAEFSYYNGDEVNAFVGGAKWQAKRMYSDEEVYHILCEHTAELFKGSKMTLTQWFERFKKPTL